MFMMFIVTQVITRVHPVHLANVGQRQAAANPQTKPTDVAVGCYMVYIHHHHLLLLILILPHSSDVTATTIVICVSRTHW